MGNTGNTILELRLPSRLEAIAGLAEEVTAFLPDQPRVAFEINLCLDELLTNTISHGLGGAGDHFIDVRLERSDAWLEVVIKDDAPAFDPFAEVGPPDLDTDLEQRPIGGLGVHFVRTLVDVVGVSHEGGGNRVTLRKRLAGHAPAG